MLLGPRTADDGLGQDGIGRRYTGGDDKRVEKVETWNEGIDEAGGDEPAPSHDRAEKDGDRLPVAQEVLFGQFDADGKDGKGDGDAHDFEGDVIGVNTAGSDTIFASPAGRIEKVDGDGPDNDAESGGNGSFTEVETLFDEEREVGKDANEEAKPDVDNMYGRDLERVESLGHGGGCWSDEQRARLFQWPIVSRGKATLKGEREGGENSRFDAYPSSLRI